MTDFATLVLGADTTGLKKGEAALNSLAATGAKTEAKVAGSMSKTSAAMTNVGKAAGGSSGNMRMFTQQLSQVGQMGAVTGNYIGALAVQLPDIGLAFGVLGTVIGTVAGVALPSLIAALGGTGSAAKAAKEAIEGLTEASANYVASSDAASISTLALLDKYGSLAIQARAALQAMKDVDFAETIQKADAAIAAISETLTYSSAFWTGGVRALRDEFDLTTVQADRLVNGILTLERADGIAAQARAASDLQARMLAIYGSAEAMPGPLQIAYDQLAGMTVAAAETQGATEKANVSIWDFVQATLAGQAGIQGMSTETVTLTGWIDVAAQKMWGLAYAAGQARTAALAAANAIPGMANPDPNAQSPSGRELQQTEFLTGIVKSRVEAEKTAKALKEMGKAGGGAGGKISEAAKEAEKALKDAEKAAEQLKEELQRPMVNAVEGVSDAFGDFVAGGLKDFKSLKDSVIGSFKSMISEMISYAVKNRIMMSMGLTTGMSPGFAAAQGGAGGGGILSTLLSGGGAAGASGGGGLGGIISGLTGGAGGVLNGLLSGGLGGALEGLTTALSGVSGGGLAGLAGAAGAIGAVVGGLGLVASFFKTKKTLLDGGFKLTVNGMKSLVETFQTVEKKKFWGLSKKVSTDMAKAEKAISDPITNAIARIQKSVLKNAAVIGVSEKVFAKFRKSIWFSTKDMSKEQIQEELQRRLIGVGNAFAKMVPGLMSMKRGGEGAADTLARVALQLRTVNATWRVLGFSLESVSVKGAKAADRITKIFGSVQNFVQATGYYFENFYTDQEKIAELQRRLGRGFNRAGIGAAVPTSVEAYRALVDSLEAAGKTQKAAKLIKLAPLFYQLQEAMNGVADGANALREALNPNDFASLFEFQKTGALLANKLIGNAPTPQIYSAPRAVGSQSSQAPAVTAEPTPAQVATATAQEQTLARIEQYLRKIALIQTEFQSEGMKVEFI